MGLKITHEYLSLIVDRKYSKYLFTQFLKENE